MSNEINKFAFIFIVAFGCYSAQVSSQSEAQTQPNNGAKKNNPAAVQLVAQAVYGSMSTFTGVFKDEIKKNLGFCIIDVYVTSILFSFS